MNSWYTDFSEYLSRIFPGIKVQKLSVDAGFSCPNRDGTIGRGGCAYCNVGSFSPGYCDPALSVASQLERGKAFFARKYPRMKYLAYFQAYTGTHDSDIARLTALYAEALSVNDIVGLVIGTRPDCLPDPLLDRLEEINRSRPVLIEIGAESSHDATLRAINRGHTWESVTYAAKRCASRGLRCGLHLICGLPGETEADILTTVDRACALPVDTLKFHQLQIIRDTALGRRYEAGEEFSLFTAESYMQLCLKIIERVPRHIAIERFLSQAPASMLLAPSWGIKNHVFTDRLHALLRAR